jgi:hypothetical protein
MEVPPNPNLETSSSSLIDNRHPNIPSQVKTKTKTKSPRVHSINGDCEPSIRSHCIALNLTSSPPPHLTFFPPSHLPTYLFIYSPHLPPSSISFASCLKSYQIITQAFPPSLPPVRLPSNQALFLLEVDSTRSVLVKASFP